MLPVTRGGASRLALPGAATTFSVVEYDRGETRPAEPLRERGEAAGFDGADAVGPSP
jgi:hypothetical protein